MAVTKLVLESEISVFAIFL